MLCLAAVDESGATSMFYHAYPWVMDFDPHSGDYGLGFFGNALESGAYYVEHSRLGPLCFLCTATTNKTTGTSTIVPEDAYHRRVFVQPLGLYLVASAGTIARVEVHSAQHPLPSGRQQLQLQPQQPQAVSLFFNATEFGETPWTKLRLTVEKPSLRSNSTSSSGCVVTHGGEKVAPVATDVNTFAFLPAAAAAQQTEVLIAC